MKIGILFPMSKMYPGMGMEFMDGLNSFFKENKISNEVELFKEGVGFGGMEKEVYLKAESLLITGEVDVLVAFVDEKVLHILNPLLQATGKIMIVVNPGANYPLNWVPQPSVIRLNLQHAFNCWLAGAEAARKANGQAALATTHYDCGYLHAAAMVNRFMECDGTILYNYINNQAYNDSFDINQLTTFLSSNHHCKNLLCVFDQQPASLFYKCLNEYAGNKELQLFVSPMMLQTITGPANSEKFPYLIDGYISWYKSMENQANIHFVESCSKPATMFSLLGWETAMILYEMLQQNSTDAEAIVSFLGTRSLASPRGELNLDPETQFYLSPVAGCRLEPGTVQPVIEWKKDLEKEWRNFTSKPTEGHVTGWTNTYLCY